MKISDRPGALQRALQGAALGVLLFLIPLAQAPGTVLLRLRERNQK